MISRKTLASTTIALAAAFCGFNSSASALKYLSLDVNPSTPPPNYISGALDQQSGGPDWVMANAFVGNFYGFECGLVDVTGMYGGSGSTSRLAASVLCTDNQTYTSGTITITGPGTGADAGAFCPAGRTAVASLDMISYN